MTDINNQKTRQQVLSELKREQAKEDRQKKVMLFSVIGVIVLIIGGALTWAALKSGGKDKDPSPTSSISAGPTVAPKNLTAENSFHILSDGSVDTKASTSLTAGKVRAEMFFDPMCPGCGLIERSIGDQVKKDLTSGKIELFLNPVAFLDRMSSDGYSTRAVNALVTVADSDPKNFYKFMVILYDEKHQPKEGENYKAVSDEDLSKLAQSVGVPASVGESFKEHKFFKWISEHTLKMNDRKDVFPQGLSTPAFILGGKTVGDKVSGHTLVDFNKGDTVLDAYNKALATEMKKVGTTK